MGLGLEMFDLRYWFAYVGAMVIFEAWLIGRWFKVSWGVSILVSVIANTFTGVLCGGLGCCAPILHQSFVGSKLDPNPFWNAVALLAGLAIPSAWLESIVWRRAVKGHSDWEVIKRSSFVHLLTVPLGLAILLIPAEPYRGLSSGRSLTFVTRALRDYVRDKEHLPTSSDPRRLVEELAPYLGEHRKEAIYTLFEVDRSRFATGERWRYPKEINRAVLGKRVPDEPTGDPRWVWFIRDRREFEGRRGGVAIDLNSWDVQIMVDSTVMNAP